MNYYRGAFTLEESQVVLVKGQPSHTHAPTPHPPSRIPFSSPSHLPPPTACRCTVLVRRAVGAFSCVRRVRVRDAAAQVRCIAKWKRVKAPKKINSPRCCCLICERAPTNAALCVCSRGGPHHPTTPPPPPPPPAVIFMTKRRQIIQVTLWLTAGCPGERWSESRSRAGDGAAQRSAPTPAVGCNGNSHTPHW